MFRYEVQYWDDIDSKSIIERGFVGAKTYGKAADKVINYYGKDNVYNVKLSELEDVLLDCDVEDILKCDNS